MEHGRVLLVVVQVKNQERARWKKTIAIGRFHFRLRIRPRVGATLQGDHHRRSGGGQDVVHPALRAERLPRRLQGHRRRRLCAEDRPLGAGPRHQTSNVGHCR